MSIESTAEAGKIGDAKKKTSVIRTFAVILCMPYNGVKEGMNEIGYTMVNGYCIPNLLPHQEPEILLGKYALLRKRFLK